VPWRRLFPLAYGLRRRNPGRSTGDYPRGEKKGEPTRRRVPPHSFSAPLPCLAQEGEKKNKRKPPGVEGGPTCRSATLPASACHGLGRAGEKGKNMKATGTWSDAKEKKKDDHDYVAFL